jgi:hypothetical protein
VVTAGIAGGMTSGATYFGIVVGSSDPPGNATAVADAGIRHGTATATPAAALALRNVRRVITQHTPFGAAHHGALFADHHKARRRPAAVALTEGRATTLRDRFARAV